MDTFMIDSKVIGQRLKALRGSKTVAEVADAVGVCASAISMYESGDRIPRDEIKLRIAKYYQRSVQDIFFEE